MLIADYERQQGRVNRERNRDLYDRLAELSPWYQRIQLTDEVTTTDIPEMAYLDGASDNTLCGYLTRREASLLRPLPKWHFIERAMPNLEGLSVLDVGSNSGFFPFEFAKMGAARVLGVEALPQYVSQAEFCRDLLDMDTVSFICDDFLFAPFEEGSFDLVFSSSVIMHMLFPFFAIYKMLTIAKRTVVLDFEVYRPRLHLPFDFISVGFKENAYHSFRFSSEVLPKIFRRMGLADECIQAFDYANRVMFMIDVADFQPKRLLPQDDPMWRQLVRGTAEAR